MRAGWNAQLEQLVRRVDVSARVVVEARITGAADIRQRLDQWQQLDTPLPSNVELLPDGGVRLRASANNGPINTTVNAFARSHLDPGSQPFFDPITNASSPTIFAGLVKWGGSEKTTIELTQVLAYLDPQHDGSIPPTVSYWQLELYHIGQLNDDGSANLVPLLATPKRAPADAAAGFVTFDLSTLASRPRPKQSRTKNLPVPYTLIVISGRQKDGTGASNVAWGCDGGNTQSTSGAGSTLFGVQVKGTRGVLSNPWGISIDLNNPVHVPGLQLILGTHTPATVGFTDTGAVNHLDLGSVPATGPELVVRGDVPAGTTLQAQVFDGAVWRNYTDGDVVGSKNNGTGQSGNDLTAVPVQRTYKLRATLTQNAAGDRSPILRALGVQVVTITDLSDVCEVTSVQQAVDPQDLHAEVPEIELRAIHDGDRDFRDAITTLLANTALANLVFRLWIGHPKLSRGLWLHVDDYFIDDYDLAGPHVSLKCLSPLCLVRGVLPVLTTEQDFLPNGLSANPGGWVASAGTAALYTLLTDAEDPNPWRDSTYIASPASPFNADITFTLPATGAPNANLGPNLNVIVQFRYALLPPGNGGPSRLIVTLFKNGVGIGSTTVLVTSTQIVTGSFTLTADAVALLGDGSGLTLQFRATSPVAIAVPCNAVLVTWARLTFLPLRSALIYQAPTPVGVVAQDLVAGQIGLDGRYRGPGIIDTVPPIGIGKTISAPANGSSPDLSIAKGELDAIGYLAGGAWISSQGRVKFAPFFDAVVDPVSGAVTYTPHQAAPVAIIPREEIGEPIAVTPGYRYRVPLFDVWWGWNEASQSWGARAPDGTVSGGGEVHGVLLQALTALGPARLMANVQLSDRIAKWIPSQPLAQGIAQRQVVNLGFGQITWRFRTTYAHPEIELGDPVAIETDRFIAYDPIAARGIAGAQWVVGYVIGMFDVWGRDLVLWIPTFSSVGTGTAQVSSQPPAPNPSTLKITVQATARAGGYLVVSWSGSPTVASVRVATSSIALGGNAPPLRGAPAGELVLVGTESAAPSGGAIMGQGGTPFGPATLDTAGLGGAPSQLVGGASAPGAPPAGSGVVLVGQSGQTSLGPFAFLDLIYVTVTPYATIDGTGAPGPAVSTQVRMLSDPGEHDPGTGLRPRLQKLVDGGYALYATNPDGSTARSTDINPQGSIPPVAADAFFTHAEGGVTTNGNGMWIALAGCFSQTLTRPDGSTFVIGAAPAGAGAPVLSQVAGGSAGARTYFVRTAYVKNGCIIATSAEASLAVLANNLLYITSPPAPAYAVDGWIPLVGTVSNGEFTQLGFLVARAIGTDIQEPIGLFGGSNAITPYNNTNWPNHIVAHTLAASTTYFFYPYYDPVLNLVLLPRTPQSAANMADAAAQNADGKIPLSFGSFTVTTPASGSSTSGSGSGGRYK